MRLIDADALKEKFSNNSFWTYIQEYGDAIPVGWIMSGIDNAPTVTNGTYEQGFRVGAYGRLDEIRPQGEWKVNNYGEHICPICGHYALYDECQDNDYYEVQSNFCPECGADMRGNKNETDN